MKFHIHTLGCRTNQYDSASVGQTLLTRGFTETPDPAEAGVIIINSCAVTERAISKTRQTAQKFSREYPTAKLLVCGCGSQNSPDLFTGISGVGGVFGVNAAAEIDRFLGAPSSETNPFGTIDLFGDRTRAHLKIEDGCDAFCTYCIVPFLRGKPVFRPFNDVVRQTERLVENGFAEIVLTGIHIGKWKDSGQGLSELLDSLTKIPGRFRLRLSSIELGEISDGLLNHVIANPKVCNHLHIPLQSGDTKILQKMKRPYSAEHFFDAISKMRDRDPYLGLGTDVITGFPGEDEESFSRTTENIQNSPLTYGHVFPYSKRKGTAAAEMGEQVPLSLCRERSRQLKKVFLNLKTAFAKTMVNRPAEVVFESDTTGLTANYIRAKPCFTPEPAVLTPVLLKQALAGTLEVEKMDKSC